MLTKEKLESLVSEHYESAKKLVLQHESVSTHLLEKELSLGYNLCQLLMRKLETNGIVGQLEGTSRKVLHP